MSADRHYSDEVWRHFLRPHARALATDDGAVFSGEARTPASQAVLAIHLHVRGQRVAAAAFQVCGCVSTIAAGSWLAQWLEGRPLDEARALRPQQIDSALSLAPEKRFCALLAFDALHDALERCAIDSDLA